MAILHGEQARRPIASEHLDVYRRRAACGQGTTDCGRECIRSQTLGEADRHRMQAVEPAACGPKDGAHDVIDLLVKARVHGLSTRQPCKRRAGPERHFGGPRCA